MKDVRIRFTLLLGLAAMVALAGPTSGQQPQQAGHQPKHRPDHMEHKFDPEASTRSFDDPKRDEWQMPSRVIGALALRPDAAVADVGAGTGYFSLRLAKTVPQGTVYAVDIEPAMLEFIRKRATTDDVTNVVTVKADASSPNIPKPVDAILIVNTYHHLPDRVSYFGALKRSLTPSGTIAIVDYKKDSPSGPPVEFRFEISHIVSEMASAGYRLEAQHDFLPRQNFLVFRPDTATR
jgi:SAM-dependent methyltransferase